MELTCSGGRPERIACSLSPKLRPLAAGSEIRFVGLRNRIEFLIREVLRLILGANHLRLILAVCLFKCKRRVERLGIFHTCDRGRSPAVLADGKLPDNVEFIGVRRTEGIDVAILAVRGLNG
jgi:hypothetical protein